MGGRKPQPTALKLLKGNPGKRKINKKEPKATPGKASCPGWLSDNAKKAWDALSNHLGNMGVLCVEDSMALELLCDAYSQFLEARKVIDLFGMTYEAETQNGGLMIRTRPEVAIASDAWRRVRAMLAEFGLTPSSRSRIKTGEKEFVDPFEEFLGKKA